MENLYTIHLTDWLGEKVTYVTENASGEDITKNVEILGRFLLRKKTDPGLLSKFDIAYDVPDEPNPIPYFVSEYKLNWKKWSLFSDQKVDVTPILTEQGVLRRAWERGEQLEKRRKEFQHPMTPFGRIPF